jgi:hypothetical protein
MNGMDQERFEDLKDAYASVPCRRRSVWSSSSTSPRIRNGKPR